MSRGVKRAQIIRNIVISRKLNFYLNRNLFFFFHSTCLIVSTILIKTQTQKINKRISSICCQLKRGSNFKRYLLQAIPTQNNRDTYLRMIFHLNTFLPFSRLETKTQYYIGIYTCILWRVQIFFPATTLIERSAQNIFVYIVYWMTPPPLTYHYILEFQF